MGSGAPTAVPSSLRADQRRSPATVDGYATNVPDGPLARIGSPASGIDATGDQLAALFGCACGQGSSVHVKVRMFSRSFNPLHAATNELRSRCTMFPATGLAVVNCARAVVHCPSGAPWIDTPPLVRASVKIRRSAPSKNTRCPPTVVMFETVATPLSNVVPPSAEV